MRREASRLYNGFVETRGMRREASRLYNGIVETLSFLVEVDIGVIIKYTSILISYIFCPVHRFM
ncbi:MAG: hypothetical protein VSS75_007645 [Candidatus Parabeggiatoa sp.]